MTDRFTTTVPVPPSSLASARSLIAARTSPVSPAWMAALLVVSAGGGLFLASVWATEPEPLPARTNVAFGLCLVIAFSWSAFAVHGLLRRRSLLVHQRVIAASMGLVFSSAFTLLGLAVTIPQNQDGRAVLVGSTGGSFIAVASVLLVRAVAARRELNDARAALMESGPPSH
ncbi:hypothetical protein Poly30_22760 [Planctomycetes bacterium Poly30]|uniref:Uncharacterized protein n=1 Tax=Saltatorellus ferox TaxID=2528018 RepID=A0A518ERN7_9BACT|nr:hypothetical protein Poly30_22760 [Planctomycetes bacterium Poly30]